MSDDTSTPGTDPRDDDFLTRILDQIVDLAQTARDWVRQEAEATIKEKVVPPLQRLGLTVASAFAAATLLVIGLICVGIAAIVWLCQWLGVPGAFLLIGVVLLVGAGIFTAIKVRGMQP